MYYEEIDIAESSSYYQLLSKEVSILLLALLIAHNSLHSSVLHADRLTEHRNTLPVILRDQDIAG